MELIVTLFNETRDEPRMLAAGETLRIGRGSEADLAFADPTMSGVHCEIECLVGEARVRDLQSRNGVFLNGKPVSEAVLHNGDQLLVGRTSFSLVIEPLAPAAAERNDNVNRSTGDGPFVAARLLPQVYDELRKLARQRLAQERPGQTLQPTALVHEAYVRLVGGEDRPQWSGRGHFFAAAAEAMRRILIEKARHKKRTKHGGGRPRVDLDSGLAIAAPEEDLVALDEALTRFAEVEPVKAELVKLRFFAGLTVPEAARALGISVATAERYWTHARVWLHAELDGSEAKPR